MTAEELSLLRFMGEDELARPTLLMSFLVVSLRSNIPDVSLVNSGSSANLIAFMTLTWNSSADMRKLTRKQISERLNNV